MSPGKEDSGSSSDVHQVMRIAFSFRELHRVHTFAGVPVQERRAVK